MESKYSVRPISTNECKPWLLKKHYLKRMTSFSFSYGMYSGIDLVGICTFGNAIPMQMKKSICGEKYMDIVYELNRLCTMDNLEKNANSFFLAKCFSLLPKPMIVVSYADKSVGHNGYVYQATNFFFTGESHTQMDWKLKGSEHLHSRTLMDEFAFQPDRVKKLKEKYGEELYQVKRPAKYRYILFLGNKTQKKQMWKDRNFETKKYPKGNNTRYDASEPIVLQTSFI